MNIALCAGSFKKEIEEGLTTLHDILNICQHYGLQGVEIRQDLLTDKEHEITKIQAIAAQKRLGLIYAYMDRPIQPDVEAMDKQLPNFIRAVDEAEQLGSNILKTGFGLVKSYEEITCEHKQVFQRLADYAKRKGVVLCLENSDKELGGDPVVMRQFLDGVDSPFVKATYDCGNFMISGRDPIEALQVLGSHIGYIHLKDAIPYGQKPTYLGMGEVDFTGLFRLLEKLGYEGYSCFEFGMSIHRLWEIEESLKVLPTPPLDR